MNEQPNQLKEALSAAMTLVELATVLDANEDERLSISLKEAARHLEKAKEVVSDG